MSKRLLDILLSGAWLLASAPCWALIPLAIKLEDGGPVFFRQQRVGKGGQVFEVLKFRSMVPPRDGEERVPQQSHPDTALVTRMGRLMRATALDELPQLWNIFRGDMSFVGPRAIPPREIGADGSGKPVDLEGLPGYRERHRVLPGLTGIAQVYAPRDIPYRQKFRYDVFYVRRRSFRLDVQLIARSVWISLRGAWPKVGEARRHRAG